MVLYINISYFPKLINKNLARASLVFNGLNHLDCVRNQVVIFFYFFSFTLLETFRSLAKHVQHRSLFCVCMQTKNIIKRQNSVLLDMKQN